MTRSKVSRPSGPKAAYRKKLLDPRWQKKRLAILERDEWECQECFSTQNTLHVHHMWYQGANPWDAPDEALVTVCENCHETQRDRRDEAERELLDVLRKRLMVGELWELASVLADMPRHVAVSLAKTSYPFHDPSVLHGWMKERHEQFLAWEAAYAAKKGEPEP